MQPGDRVETAAFSVTALPAGHIRLPGFGCGAARPGLAPPLRAWQYRMDMSLAFLVQAGGYRLLIGPGFCSCDPGPVDALLCCPLYPGNRLGEYVCRLKPHAFVPIHWEDMFLPEGKPPKPGIVPAFPPKRADMRKVARRVEALGVRFFLPERGKEYFMEELF
jgi:hypothetical protein